MSFVLIIWVKKYGIRSFVKYDNINLNKYKYLVELFVLGFGIFLYVRLLSVLV